MKKFKINDVLWALSTAIDYVGITDTNHGKRVAYYAIEINKYLQHGVNTDDIIFSCLLHDCGVSRTDVHEKLISQFKSGNVFSHCERGYELIQNQPLLAHLKNIILHHHTPWCELAPLNNITADEKKIANLIFLADRLDVLMSKANFDVASIENVKLKCHSGISTLFSEEIIAAFEKASLRNSFWYVRNTTEVTRYFDSWIKNRSGKLIDINELEVLSLLFSSCVDAKSEFTAQHSVGTRNIAIALAKNSNISDDELIKKIGIAALLHDLGKLRVPDAVLDKVGRLNDDDLFYIRRHSFDSQQILHGVTGFNDVAKWVGQHHEKLNGLGYPFMHHEQDIPLESRIIAVADIFQALVQKRPYRKNLLEKNDVIKILLDNVTNKSIDAVLTHKIIHAYDYYHELAISDDLYSLAI